MVFKVMLPSFKSKSYHWWTVTEIISKPWPLGKSNPLTAFVNKVLLQHWFTFYTIKTELNSWDLPRSLMSCKTKTLTVWLFIEKVCSPRFWWINYLTSLNLSFFKLWNGDNNSISLRGLLRKWNDRIHTKYLAQGWHIWRIQYMLNSKFK